MNKIKKLTLLLGVALTLLTPVLGLIPPTQGRAYAAPNDEKSIGDQVQAYISYRAIAHCILVSGLADKEKGAWESYTRVDENHATSFEWFSGGWGDEEASTWVGYLDNDDGNGKSSCHDSVLLQEAYEIWQLGGSSDGITSICYSGFQREGEEFEKDTPEECVQGTSDQFVRPNKDKAKAAETFLKNVRDQFYGGKEPVLTDAMRWYLSYHSVQGLCDATRRDDPETYSEEKVKNDKRLVYMIGPDGTKEVWALGSDFDEGKDVTIGTNSSISDSSKKSCGDLAKDAANSTYAGAYRDWAEEHPELASQDTNNVEGSGEIEVNCGGKDGWDLKNWINPLDWLSCSVLQGFTTAAKSFDNLIMGMLCINENDLFGATATCGGSGGVGAHEGNTDEAFHNAWSVFRILALGLLAIGGLVMIISQGLGFEIFDAYTVKKTLPRILVAAIGISLSWEILQFLVMLSNGLGVGIRALIYAPFKASGVDTTILGGGESAIAALFFGGAFISLGALGLLSFIGTALLAILIGFFLLVVRNIIVIMLILVAPVAIAAYILPNTEKYYKSWWSWLVKALLVFPLITAFIAIGHVFAAITTTNGGTLTSFVAFAAYFAPYFMIPLAFRFAGGLMATLGGFANDRSRGGFDRLKKYRGGQVVRNTQRLSDGERFNNASLNRLSARATTRRLGFGAQGRAAYDQKMAIAGMRHAKSDQGQAGQHNDFMLRAQTYESEAQARAQMATDWGMSQDEVTQSIAAARANGGFGRNRQVYAAKRLAETGTGYANLQQVAETTARVSNGNEGIMADVAGNINSTTKAQGRFDLAPGYGNLVGLAQAAHAGTATQAQYHQATVTASRGADPVTILRGKPAEVENFTNALHAHAANQQAVINNVASSDEEVNAARDELLMTMGQIDQLDQSKSYASAENQQHVNNLMDRSDDIRRDTLNPMITPVDRTDAYGRRVSGPRTQAEAAQDQVIAANRHRYDQVRAPRINNPNDPRNQQP